MTEPYTHGHHESVLRSHRWRTAENSAGYLLRHLSPGQSLLDVGCGPGTLTIDLARRVAPGLVAGIDAADEAVAAADELLQGRPSVDNVRFSRGDVHAIPFADASFDVVHAHQLLQHLKAPLEGLMEMRRVLDPHGILAVREADYGAFMLAPADPVLDRWLRIYHSVAERLGATADAGRYLLGWVQGAGFSNPQVSSSTWTFADPESRAWWGELWAERVQLSAFSQHALKYALADVAELEAIADAWRSWAMKPDAVFVVPHVEIVAAW